MSVLKTTTPFSSVTEIDLPLVNPPASSRATCTAWSRGRVSLTKFQNWELALKMVHGHAEGRKAAMIFVAKFSADMTPMMIGVTPMLELGGSGVTVMMFCLHVVPEALTFD
jgi:hypothetical protein